MPTSNSQTLAHISADATTPGKPCGFYVLVELVEVEQTTASGLYVGDVRREQSAEESGYVRAIGPTAFNGWQGCDVTADEINQCYFPYHAWGIDIGNLVEFRSFEGKKCTVPGFERWRYIPDSHIVGVIDGE